MARLFIGTVILGFSILCIWIGYLLVEYIPPQIAVTVLIFLVVAYVLGWLYEKLTGNG